MQSIIASCVYKNKSFDYKNAKYLTTVTTTAKVGLLRLGELMAGQFDIVDNNSSYWLLTPYDTSSVRYVTLHCVGNRYNPTHSWDANIRPAMNLKSNVVITSGDGTKSNPFQIKLGS